MTTITTLLTLEVARAVNAAAAENACDSVEVIVDRVEICYRNETFAKMSDELRENDPLGVQHRDIVPLDSDDVKLYAIIWAKEPAEENFKPYCGDSGFDNNGMFFQVGEIKGSPGGRNRSPLSWYEQMLDEKLDSDIKRVEPWKWCRELTFDWKELAFAVSSKTKVNGDVVDRTYRYTETALEVEAETEAQKHGWVVKPTPKAGTRRFRVLATLPEGVRLVGEDQERTGETTIASRVKRNTKHRKGYNKKGFALRLSVRKANVPEARTTELTEMLRWGTAFIDVPYYNGGQWLGGRAADDVSQQSDGTFSYQGHGFDCNGFICAVAELAGLDWALRENKRAKLREEIEDDEEFEKAARKDFELKWRFSTLKKRGRLFPGAQVASGDDLQPGDLLDFTGHSHVALVWELFEEEDGSQRIRVLDCSGGQDGVSLRVLTTRLASIDTKCQLVDFSDPQKRPW